MTAAFVLSTLLLAAPVKGRPPPSHLQQAQRLFNKGDFDAALRSLDSAVSTVDEPQTLARIHLLRGQVYAAQQDFSRAEEAFALALENDPAATLDPARVDPAVVKLLDGLRLRLSGELAVNSEQPGVRVWYDGKLLGVTPLKAKVAIGVHALEAKSADARRGAKREVIVRARQVTTVELELAELPPEIDPPKGTSPVNVKSHAFAELRGTMDPVQFAEGLAVEVGGGMQQSYFRGSVGARVFPEFGVALRGGVGVPVAEKLTAFVELELPTIFASNIWVGFGGCGGVEYQPSKWLGLFIQGGARQYFLGTSQPSRLSAQTGVRLWLP